MKTKINVSQIMSIIISEVKGM